jgi:putative membrane protein
MMWEGSGPWDHGSAWGGEWLLWIGLFVAIVAAIVMIVLLVKVLSASTGNAPAAQPPTTGSTPAVTHAETPRDIVQRRYAKGEIDREEYLQKLADL